VCNTPVSAVTEAAAGKNKILSLFPVPAGSSVTCTTSLTDVGSFEIRSVSGITAMAPVPVNPGESTCVKTSHLEQGYYLMVLRNKSGTIVDYKPLIIQNR
jgi:hypothetical protein